MKKLIRKYKPELFGILGGSVAGWCYWYFIGCSSGTCAITSSPVNSSLYGAMMGGLLVNAFSTKNKDSKKENKA